MAVKPSRVTRICVSSDVWRHIGRFLADIKSLLCLRLVCQSSVIAPFPLHWRAFGIARFQCAVNNGHVEALQYLKDMFHITADDARAEKNYALRMAAPNGDVAMLNCLRNIFGLTVFDVRQFSPQ